MGNTLSNFVIRQREFTLHCEITKHYGLSYVIDINNNYYDITSSRYQFLHFNVYQFFFSNHRINALLKLDDDTCTSVIITVPLKRGKTNTNPLTGVNVKVDSFNAKIAL